jgi:hypothetical protein
MNQAQETNVAPAAEPESDRLTVEMPTEIRAGLDDLIIIVVYYNCKSRRVAS